MTILPESIEEYIEQFTSKEDEFLNQINRETHLNTTQPQMLSGHYQGVFLELMSRSVQPKRILEIGTFTGYSAICLAKGLQVGGMLHTIDVNEELMQQTKESFEKSGFKEQIVQHIGDAKDIIPTLHEVFDLVFIDADKAGYPQYFDLVVEKVRRNGVIIVDNVLWKGKVFEDEKDKKTQILHDFNAKVQADNRVKNILLPIRDGVMWIVKQ